MNKLRVIIADNEKESIELMRNLLTDTQKVEIVAEISDSLKVESAVNKYNPDVLFLDIEMPGLNGISLLENIREYNQKLAVVFVTAFERYVNDAIKLNVFSYLMKPVDRLELLNLINKLSDLNKRKEPAVSRKIKIPVNGGYAFIKPNELLLLEAEGNYTRLKTTYGEELISSYNMGYLYKKLPQNLFLRVNRSCIINGDFIYKIDKKNNLCIVRLNGEELTFNISASFLSMFNKALF